MIRRALVSLFATVAAVMVAPLISPTSAFAQAPQGECASGFCGTPNNNGGGGAANSGGSVLVNNTDIGKTYSTSDDYDGDGFEDDFDNCLFTANRDQADSDGDKVGNMCDNCPAVANGDQRDTDGDRLGDACDDDIDNDNKPNAADNCPAVPNLSQVDTDADGKGDACDPDIDNDGVPNRQDNCPMVANPGQESNVSGASGAACDNDSDKDGILDSIDNCIMAGNADQLDTDGDGFGDACDLDIDNDKIANAQDNCPTKQNPDQLDADRDGLGDLCDIDGFCFVAGKNRAARCLDPRAVFSVTAAPNVKAKTGEDVFLTFYANRESVGIRYSFAVVDQPAGAGVTVKNPRGNAHQSTLFEYRYTSEDKRPTFMPTEPGTYKILLTAELESADATFPTMVTAQHALELVVTGEAKDSSGGCSVGGRSSPAGLAILSVLGLFGVVLRRRRKA